MSLRSAVIRSVRVAPEITVHLDGHVQQGQALSLESIAELEGAADIVNEAQLRADELRASAIAEMTEMRAEGYRLGHAEGYRDGTAVARAALADELELVQAAGRAAKAVRDSVVAAAERDIIELVIAAAQAVVGEHARLDHELVLQSIERAAQRLGAQNALRVRINPADTSTVQASLAERDGAAGAWEVLADGGVSIGGCVIETATGEIDARLDVQMDAVARVLRTAAPDAA